MFLTVHYNYGGNWTALYLIGPRTPVPPGIPAERLYIFPNNTGYDGQSFHVMAHDPWMRRSTPAAVEIEPFRYARILVPAIAWMLVLGHDPWIEPAYFTTILAFVFLGVFWMATFALRVQLHPAWGLTFLLSPATLTSLDRMTVDVALAALCVALALYYDSASQWRVIVILALMLLTRETAWFIFGAYEVFLLTRRRLSDAEVIATAAIPVIVWHVFIVIRSGQIALPPPALGLIPLAGFLDRLAHPAVYDLTPGIARLAVVFDYVALVGIAIAVIVALRMLAREVTGREPATPISFAIFAMAPLVLFLVPGGGWSDAYAFGRIFAPLLILIAMVHLSSRSLSKICLGLAPTLLVDARIVLNLGKQALGILHGLLH